MDFAAFKPQSNPKPYELSGALENLYGNDWSCQIYYRKSDHTFWYKSASRFFVYDLEKGILFDFNIDYPDIAKNQIHDIYFDKKGIAWISTSQGFYSILLTENPIRWFLYNPSTIYDVNSFISCRGIARTKNTLWLGTELKYNHKIDLITGQSEILPYFQGLGEFGQPQEYEGRIIIQGNENQLFFGERKLMDYRISDGSYNVYAWEDGLNHQIWSMYKDQHERVWAGAYDGPLGYWKEGMNHIEIYKKFNGFDFPNGGFIYHFLELDKENMLISTSFGIYLLNYEKGILKRYWTGGKGDAYFPSDNVFHMIKDKDKEGVIWVATGGGGLVSWQFSVGSSQSKPSTVNRQPSTVFHQFTIAEGLSNNTIYAVYEDEVGNFWLPSDYGIIQFNKRTHFTKAYLKKDGITYDEFNRTSHHQDKEGNLYFGGLNGVTAFHPNDFLGISDTLDVPLRITEFQQHDFETGKLIDKTAEILESYQIVLQPKDYFFNLKFALLEYGKAARIRYAYKIVGQDSDWNLIADNSVRISGLGYGDFALRIRGQGSNGQFSKQELWIPISVLKPVYLQTWFLILSILAGLALIWSFIKFRTSHLKKQKILLEKMVHERTETIKKQNEELQNLDKIKSQFFANVSHELRTPLTLMLGPVSSMLKSNQLNNRNFTFAKLIQNNAKDLLNLVSEILDLTKLESGKLELNEAPITFYPFTERVISAFESHAYKQNIQFEFHYQADHYLQLNLDKNKFEKILNNLLSNAFKFTAPDGNITVQIEDLANRIQLKVSDTGRGIHPDDLPHIFNRFYQSKQSNAPTEGGTGIGLALCMEFANLMKGKLWVKSTLGKGSSFYFEFPKKQVLGVVDSKDFSNQNKESQLTQESEIMNPIKAKEEEKRKKETILVVEDNHALRDYIQLILSDKYKVVTAENGQIAWDILNKKKNLSDTSKVSDKTDCQLPTENCQLILSDIMMPFLDGYQLLQKLKESDQFWHLPVIMLTARGEMQDKLKALRIGVDDYMLKPFEEEELFARIENLLRNSRERKLAIDSSQPEVETTDNRQPTTEIDLRWLEDLEMTVKKELSGFNFNVEMLADKMAMSKRPLEIKIKHLTGLTPSKYIQEIRFNQARQMLENRTESTVKAVVISVGLKDPIHFSRQFKARFGKSPADYFQYS